jgi:hypothetical protein
MTEVKSLQFSQWNSQKLIGSVKRDLIKANSNK